MLLDDQELRERVGRIETLLEEIESFEDPEARAKTAEMVQALLELYGEGLGRIVESVGRLGGEDLKAELLGDELITHLLLLHGLHPVDVETRVLGALDEVRPYLESHGGNVQFLGIGGGVARLRLGGRWGGCPSSTMTLKLAIEEAVQKAAPELEGVEAEGVAEPPPKPTMAFVAAPTMRKKKKKPPQENGSSSWTTIGELDLPGGGLRAALRRASGGEIAGRRLAVAPGARPVARGRRRHGQGRSAESGGLKVIWLPTTIFPLSPRCAGSPGRNQ